MNTWFIILFARGDLIFGGSRSMTTVCLLTPTHGSHRLLKQPCVSMKPLRPRKNCLRQSVSETFRLVLLIWDAGQATNKGHIEPSASSHKEFLFNETLERFMIF